MTTTLDAYRAFLREIDKHESPSCNVGTFVYHFNSSIEEYITINYATMDVNQKTLDDMRAILVLGGDLTFTNGEADLPEEYRHMLGLEAVLKFSVAAKGHAIDSELTVHPKRLRTNRNGYVSANAYHEPSYKHPFFQIAKSKIRVLSGTGVSVTTGKIDYLEIPQTMYLNPNQGVDYNDPANNTVLQFPEHVNFEIIKHCRKIFLENIESPRYQSSLQESVLRNE